MAASLLFPRCNFPTLINTRNFSLGTTLYKRPKGYWGQKKVDGDVVTHRTTLHRETVVGHGVGLNVGAGGKGHIFAIKPGKVVITTEKTNFNLENVHLVYNCPDAENITYMKYYHVIPDPQHNRFKLVDKI